MKVVCVVPAFNTAGVLPKVIDNLRSRFNEIVLVNDGSRDKTAEVAESLGITVLHHLVNRGQGAALKTGTEYALSLGAEIIVHFDSDGQFLVEDAVRLVEIIEKGEADMVFGSRFFDKKTKMPFLKRYLIMPLARAVNRLFGIRFTDPQSGFRVFNRSVALQLNWQQDRMAHCSEILATAHTLPIRLKEIPITVIYNEFGQTFGGGLRIIRDLLLARLNR